MTNETSNEQKPFFVAYNAHTPGCGEPPTYQAGTAEGRYHGFFANQYGEQWVFEYDYATEKGFLRGGDVGWNQVYEVEGPSLREKVSFEVQTKPGLVLSPFEHLWLRACWEVAIAGREDREQYRREERV